MHFNYSNMIRSICGIALIAVMVTLSACGIFDTREAESGDGAPSSWQVPTVPNLVFINMQTGLQELDGVNYTRSIADDFTFVPHPDDASDQSFPPGHYDNWTRQNEVDVVNRLVGESTALTLTWSNQVLIRDENPFADYTADYELEQITLTVPPDTIVYRGKAQIDMRDGSKGWQVVRWEDIEVVPPDRTWGYLRGLLKQ